ncbi:MAG: NAD-dependent epimerase/dehydratase family protein, partial [Bacteroidota bacterium]
MNKTNIVIGATGIVGSHVVLQLLLEKQKVVACKQKSSDTNKLKRLFSVYTENSEELFASIEWREIDLKDVFSIEDAIEGADTVYHCAGFVSFNSFERKQLMDVNVEGTKNIVNACLQKQITSFCYVSSLATMHNLDVKETIDETVFWKTSGKESDYAFSKYKAELEVWRGIE